MGNKCVKNGGFEEAGLKFNISVDDKEKQLAGIKVTDESMHDTDEFKDLIDQFIENIKAANGKILFRQMQMEHTILMITS